MTGAVIIVLIGELIGRLTGGKSIGLTGTQSIVLTGAIMGGLIGGLKSELSRTEVKRRTLPNQGIWNSSKNAIKIALIGGPVLGMSYGLIVFLYLLVLNDQMSFGLIGGLRFVLNNAQIGLLLGASLGFINGGATCIQYFNLRQILFQKGRIPWNYARFLDYATELRLMKKVGGGYIFYHRMLMEHFANMELDKSTMKNEQ